MSQGGLSVREDLGGMPVNLLLRGRRVVVVGGGRIAARKVASLLDVGAAVEVIAPTVSSEIEALGLDGRLAVTLRPFRPADLDGAWLAVSAADDPTVNEAVFVAGEAQRVFVNAADDPAHCSATLLSGVRRGSLQSGVGTGGRSPALAAWLREKLEAEVGPEYGTLLDLLSEQREAVRAEGRSSEDVDWREVLDSGILELIRAGRVHEVKERLKACRTSSSG